MDFKLNPYDLCVVNKEINGLQCTIIWHINNNKISHKSKEAVEGVIDSLEKKFGIILLVSFGPVCDF